MYQLVILDAHSHERAGTFVRPAHVSVSQSPLWIFSGFTSAAFTPSRIPTCGSAVCPYHSINEVCRVGAYSHAVQCRVSYYASLNVLRGLLVLIKPDHIREGAILICIVLPCFLIFFKGIKCCAPCAEVSFGFIAIVCINGDEGTLKRVKITTDRLALIPNNPKYGTMLISKTDVETLAVTASKGSFLAVFVPEMDSFAS